MRWRKKPVVDEWKWHRCFAWLPVDAGGQWVWMEFVEARKRWAEDAYFVVMDPEMIWEYRLLGGEARQEAEREYDSLLEVC